ncbi:MAG TPA: hypothetical protein VNG51_23170 [Ktedonobacteraceae bacterium]|nr:hypothetical protein [Ktedonobacteraceae bacterium]
MLANERKRIRKGQQTFGVPGSLTNGKGLLIQQLLSKNGDERKECQQGGRSVCNRQLRPLALRLDAQMSTYLMKGDFQRTPQDKPLDILGRFCLLIGAKQGQLVFKMRSGYDRQERN